MVKPRFIEREREGNAFIFHSKPAAAGKPRSFGDNFFMDRRGACNAPNLPIREARQAGPADPPASAKKTRILAGRIPALLLAIVAVCGPRNAITIPGSSQRG